MESTWKRVAAHGIVVGVFSGIIVWTVIVISAQRTPGGVPTAEAGAAERPDRCRCPDSVTAWMRDPADWPDDAFAHIDICGSAHALTVDMFVEDGPEDAAGGLVEVTVRAHARMNGADDVVASTVFAAAFLETHAALATGTNSRRDLDAILEDFAFPGGGILFSALTEGELICVHRYDVSGERYRP